MSREIRGHWVFGKAILVKANSEASAREEVRKQTSLHIWDMKELSYGMWEVYVAKDENCFATND